MFRTTLIARPIACSVARSVVRPIIRVATVALLFARPVAIVRATCPPSSLRELLPRFRLQVQGLY